MKWNPAWHQHVMGGLFGTLVALLAVLASAALLMALAMAVLYPSLPDISDLTDYRPKLPLSVYSAEGVLIGAFGEERRTMTPIAKIPALMKYAVLSIEDARFYSHSGVDYRGLVRAALANLGQVKSQGASTITMQVARNAYLTSEKTYNRKIFEVLLTFKLEHLLSKDQILEIYMNQVFLGNRSYGFAAASETYFGKTMNRLSVAEAAMLAGLPKAPSSYNPISNPRRAALRQQHIIGRMLANGYITAEEAVAARNQVLSVRSGGANIDAHAEYLAETVRQSVYLQYGEEAYTRGLNVTTTLNAVQQEAAYRALRKGITDYERRQAYRGPEAFVDLPPANDADPEAEAEEDSVDEALTAHPDNGDVLAAVVLQVEKNRVLVARPNRARLEISAEGLKPVRSGLAANAPDKLRLRRGAVVRIALNANKNWEITQLPLVEGAFVAMDPRNGAIRTMVGGFDFNKNKFNHVTQAWRQPGSAFKPFIYSAALEKGFTPSTVVNDAPLVVGSGAYGSQPWAPKNYGGKFAGPMPLHTALAKSVNTVTVRVLMAVGVRFAQTWITRFGFDRERHPPYLPMGLGAGAVTPLQMASAYSVFANGGHRLNPWLISKITDQRGNTLLQPQPTPLAESSRAIDARNAFVMLRLLSEVTRSGTAAKAQATLKRADLYGKTGTTNGSFDTWFAGFQPTLCAVVWMGFDAPRSLGDRETGGGLSLPVWIAFMETALREVPVQLPVEPDGVINVGGEWYFEEFSPASQRARANQAATASATASTASAASGAAEPAAAPASAATPEAQAQ